MNTIKYLNTEYTVVNVKAEDRDSEGLQMIEIQAMHVPHERATVILDFTVFVFQETGNIDVELNKIYVINFEKLREKAAGNKEKTHA